MSPEQDPAAAAEEARARLYEEIERVRRGVEEMLGEQRLGRRIEELERRLEREEQERRHAEWRIHTNTELLLDGLLRETRAIADRLASLR